MLSMSETLFVQRCVNCKRLVKREERVELEIKEEMINGKRRQYIRIS